MTKQVTIRCAHEDNSASQLQEVSRIRLLKKSAFGGGWELLAELRDNENTPKAYINVSVSAKISSNIQDNFIEIVWPIAIEETYGTYRCDVIGFDKNTFLNTAEVTSEVALLEENVTTSDMLDMFLETKDEMHHIEDDTKHLEDDMTAMNKKIIDLGTRVYHQGKDVSQLEDDMDTVRQSLNLVTGDVANLKGDIGSLKSDMDSVNENTRKIDSLNRDLEVVRRDASSLADTSSGSNASRFSLLMSWPTGKYALLQPKTGCPVDLTFFGGSVRYWQIHTESRSRSVSRNAHSDALSPKTLSTSKGNKFFTLNFCEANGILNSASWPAGSYCINRLYGVPCPSGFSEGRVHVDAEDSSTVIEYTSRSVDPAQNIAFCCMSSGHYSVPINLPTHSPFLLYRRGGRCQQISGMVVSEETITIDTEDVSNNDNKYGSCPDVDLNSGSTIKINLCHYTSI